MKKIIWIVAAVLAAAVLDVTPAAAQSPKNRPAPAPAAPVAPVAPAADRAGYYGTWEIDGGQSRIVLNEDGYVFSFLSNGTRASYTLSNLTWEAVENTAGSHTSGYPAGYKITGTITVAPAADLGFTVNILRPDGRMTAARVGEQAVEWFYLRRSDDGALMRGDRESRAHEARYGPFLRQSAASAAAAVPAVTQSPKERAAAASAVPAAPAAESPADRQADYYGVWKRDGSQGSQVTLSRDEYVYVSSSRSSSGSAIGYTMSDLTWEPLENTAGAYTGDYPAGYKITGTLTRVPPAGVTISTVRPDGSASVARLGERAVEWFYLRSADQGALMMGDSAPGVHEAKYGPFLRQP